MDAGEVKAFLGGDGGWDELNKLDGAAKVDPKVAKALQDSAIHFKTTFGTMSGRQVLTELVEMTINQPCFLPNEGLNPEQMGFVREGQNSIVRYIQQQIKKADGSRDMSFMD